MTTLLIVLHVIFCVFLILVILLQTGKGAGIGAAFGGGSSQTVFGPRGAGSFIGKLTGIVAALFMITSLVLAYVSSSKDTGLAAKGEALNQMRSSGEEVDLDTLVGKDSTVKSEEEAATPDSSAAEESEAKADNAAGAVDVNEVAPSEPKPATEEEPKPATEEEPKPATEEEPKPTVE